MALDDELERHLQALGMEFRRGLSENMREVEDCWSRTDNGGNFGALREVQRRLHSMAGSGKTFGVAGLSETAAAAEAYIEPFVERAVTPDSAQCAEFEALLARVRNVISSS